MSCPPNNAKLINARLGNQTSNPPQTYANKHVLRRFADFCVGKLILVSNMCRVRASLTQVDRDSMLKYFAEFMCSLTQVIHVLNV